MLQSWLTLPPSHSFYHHRYLPQAGFPIPFHLRLLKASPVSVPLPPYRQRRLPASSWSLVRSLLHRYLLPSTSLKESLSKEQLLAVETKDTCVRVVAGPGSGKTRVLTHRVVHLMSSCGVQPDEILFITFTNKAAQEIRERLEQIFGPQAVKDMTVATFHGFCAKVLRWQPCFGINSKFAIYDESDCEKLLRSILKTAQGALSQEDSSLQTGKELRVSADKRSGHLYDLERLGFLTNGSVENQLLKTCLASKEKSEEKGYGKTVAVPSATIKILSEATKAARLYKLTCFLAEKTTKGNAPQLAKCPKKANLSFTTVYENALRRNNAVDFHDLIHLVVQLLHTNHDVRKVCQQRWKHILVDEFQDTDRVQYELIRLLSSNNQNLFVVGDIDQAIYGWRGAEFRHMQKSLEMDFPSITTFQLRENYRSSPNIVRAASVILKFSRYDRRIGSLQALSLVPTIKESKMAPIGIGEFAHQNMEADFIISEIRNLVSQKEAIWGSFALLYRTRFQALQLGAALSKARIPYRVLGGTAFYTDKEVKTLLDYLHYISNPENIIALDSCLNKPPRGIGEKSVDSIKQWASHNNLSFSQALEKINAEFMDHKELGIRLSSRNSIIDFMKLIQDMRERSHNSSVSHLLHTLIHKLNFEAYLSNSSNADEFEKHMEHIQQLLVSAGMVTSIHGIGDKGLSAFLEDITLLANHEETLEGHSSTVKNEVKLLTLHGSKGMEFDVVFLVGASDNVIPLEGSDLDEERRLFYVGITRARKRMYVTHSLDPLPWQTSKRKISRFVKELTLGLPPHYYKMHWSTEPTEPDADQTWKMYDKTHWSL